MTDAVFGWSFAVALALAAAWLVWGGRRATRRAKLAESSERDELIARLESSETLLLQGDAEASVDLLGQIEDRLGAFPAPDGSLLRAWHRVAFAEHAARSGHRGRARTLLESALEELVSAPASEDAAEFRRRALAALGFLAAAEDRDPAYLAYAARARAEAANARRPDAVLAMVWLEARLADYHHALGSWPKARAAMEAVLGHAERWDRTAESHRSFWSEAGCEVMRAHARATASGTAIRIGEMEWALGDHDASSPWLDRAIRWAEDVPHPIGRAALARALLARGRHVPATPLADLAPRRAWLERAVQVGLEAEAAGGRAIASEAELELAALHESVGATERALEHTRRARDHARGAGHASFWPHAIRALVKQGILLRDQGGEPPVAAFREALELGRESPHPEIRQHAATAAHQLHALLLERVDLDAARAALEAMDALVPTLDPAVRELYVIAGMRAHTHHAARTARWDEARGHLARAEAVLAESRSHPSLEIRRTLAMDRGDIEAGAGELEAALPCYRRALEYRTEPDPPSDENAARAEVHLKRARTLLGLDRVDEALHDLERAYALGRDSGESEGRAAAAIAALIQGDLAVDRVEERRALYETAARMGALSGSRRGIEVGKAANLRRTELSGRKPREP